MICKFDNPLMAAALNWMSNIFFEPKFTMCKKGILSIAALIFITLVFTGCNSKTTKKLPVLGRKTIEPITVDGEVRYDTINHTIRSFAFMDQDSVLVTNNTFADKIYVADFFFTTCPTICPIMKAQMLRIYDTYKNENDVLILSHTIDPEHDNVTVLNEFASRLGVKSKKWHFVTGEREKIYEIAQSSYMVTALADENEPGGYIHSGAFILVDKSGQIRGLYDGTDAKDVDRLIKDIKTLLREYEAFE